MNSQSIPLEHPSLLGSFTIRDVLVHVFYHARLIRNCLLAGALLGLLGAVAARPQHTADSLLMILNGPGGVPEELSAASAVLGAVPRAVQSDMEIVQSEPVIRDAIVRVGPTRLFPDLKGRGPFGLFPRHDKEAMVTAAIDRFRQKLKVTTEPGSNLIKVSYASPDRAMSVVGLNALIDAYAERRKSIYAGAAPKLQEQEVRRYAALLSDLDRRIKNAQSRYDVLNIAQDVELVANRQENITIRLNAAVERGRSVEAELATVRKRLAATPKQVFDFREVTNGVPNDDARNLLHRLKQERAHLAEQYQPTWPAIKELDERIAIAEAQIQSNLTDQYYTDKKIRNPTVDHLEQRHSNLLLERAAVARQVEELKNQLAETQGRIRVVRQGADELGEMLRNREVMQGVYRQLSLQQAGAKVQNDSVESRQASLRVVQPPTAAAKPKNAAPLWLLAGITIGAAAAAAVIVIAAVLRQTFISPNEAERTLRLPTLAELSEGESDFDGAGGHHEVTRLAAFIVDSATPDSKLQVVQIAAGKGEQDKVPLTLALAREFAEGWSYETLVVDLDGGAFANLASRTAERSKMPAAGDELELIHTTTPKLWALSQPTGRDSPLTGERLPLERAEAILQALRGRFQRILLIAPSDYEDYGARRLNPLVDAHILVVRAERSKAPVLRRLRDVILTSGGDMLGLVYTHRRFYIPERVYRWL